jgi:hypothetical protein
MKGKPEQRDPIRVQCGRGAIAANACENRLVDGQVLCAHEAELVEEGMAGGKAGEQFDDGLRNLAAHVEQRPVEPGLREHAQDVRIVGEAFDGETGVEGRAEQ